jgi:hypothetical protein
VSIWVIGVRSYSAEVADWARDAGLRVEGFLTPGDLRGPFFVSVPSGSPLTFSFSAIGSLLMDEPGVFA